MLYNLSVWTLTSYIFSVLLCFGVVQGNGVNLGQLHWCDTLCLCHDETQAKMHCFEEQEIYSLLEVDPRQVQRLISKANFKLKERLTWCSETCLCHKEGRKEFKCSDNVKLGVFISDKAPHLADYLEPEVEVFDVRDVVDRDEEFLVEPTSVPFEEKPERKDRHDRKKSKKHRKNKKKGHHEEVEEVEEMPNAIFSTPSVHISPPELTTAARPHEVIVTTESDNARVLSAAIIPQASTGRGIPSRSPDQESSNIVSERKTIGEFSNDLLQLKDNVDLIKEDVALNQGILLVTIAIAAISMIGVLILAIYLCCVRKSSKKASNKQRSVSQHQHEENSVTKANLDEAW